MTCIVGIANNGNVYMGGDSAGVSGLSITIRADEKVFINGPFIMGFTTSFRMGQLLQYKFSPKQQTTDQSDMAYMVSSFIDDCRKCFTDNGYGSTSKGGKFLVGYKGVLYTIDEDFQVGKSNCAFDAVGSGYDLALGALCMTEKLEPKRRIELALKAAATFNAGVAPPYLILEQINKAKKTNNKKKVS